MALRQLSDRIVFRAVLFPGHPASTVQLRESSDRLRLSPSIHLRQDRPDMELDGANLYAKLPRYFPRSEALCNEANDFLFASR